MTCVQSNLDNLSRDCLETDSTKADTCMTCKKNFHLIERVEECELADKFKGTLTEVQSKCVSWVDGLQCSDCDPMYYGKTCEIQTG